MTAVMKLVVGALLALGPGAAETLTVSNRTLQVQLLHEEDFEGVVDRWRFDGRGRQWIEDGRLQMSADGFECTAWFTEQMEGDLLITYQARILEPVDANNINVFILGMGPDGGDVLNVLLTGSYPEYHKLPNYIWTFTRSHTRLRKDPGFHLLSEDKKTLPVPNRTYQFAVTIDGGKIRCYIDDRLIHSYDDPNRHRTGKLAFRTFHTRLWWDNLRVYRIISGGPRSAP